MKLKPALTATTALTALALTAALSEIGRAHV